jgi:toluene monooxygenase electron transfer component
VIKRFPGGRFSEALFAGGAAEYRVDVFGPMGLATFDPGENRDLICLVGGSGIAGIMSILSQAASLDYFKKHRLTIVFGVRRLEDFFFIEELKVVQKSAPEHIQINLAISDFQAGGSVDSQVHGFALHHGFVHEVAEQLNGNVFSERLAFLGGPPAMLTGSLALLLGVGTPVADIRYDKFG